MKGPEKQLNRPCVFNSTAEYARHRWIADLDGSGDVWAIADSREELELKLAVLGFRIGKEMKGLVPKFLNMKTFALEKTA